MATAREVDKIPKIHPRPQEMEVLCLGLPRTSTMTMCIALNKLGYRTYHGLEIFKPYNKVYRHANCWAEALNDRVYGNGILYGPKEIDKILQEYSALSGDIPHIIFTKELVAAFPNAKVILTQRDPISWDGMGAIYEYVTLSLSEWTTPRPWTDREALKDCMANHVALVRSIVPMENLLEFHPRDGWEPLCKFIGKDIPTEPFPHVNKGNSIVKFVGIGIAIKLLKMGLPYMLAIGVAVASWRWVYTE